MNRNEMSRRHQAIFCDSFPEKKQYDREGEALEAAERASKRERIPVRYYLCPDCSQYHLSKMS